MYVLSSNTHTYFTYVLYIVIVTWFHTIQSGSQLSVNQEAVDPSLVASSQVVQGDTDLPINPQIGSVDTFLNSSYITPFCTPVLLELHIDEDGCSVPTTSAGSTVLAAPSKYSQIQQKGDGGSVFSELSHVEHQAILITQELSEVNSSSQMSGTKVSTSKAPGLVVVSKSPNLVTVSKNQSPILRTKSPSPPDLKSSGLTPEPISHISEATDKMAVPKAASPVTVPRLSSQVPKSPMTDPNISYNCSVPIPRGPNPETVPKSASPVSMPRLSSPLTLPSITSSPIVPKSYSPERSFPVIPPTLSSPVTVPKSPTPVARKTYTVPGTSSPRASPVSRAAALTKRLSPPPTEKGEVLDLTWPCREPLLDDALDKLLAPDSTQPADNQPPAPATYVDEDRFWEEEDGLYPDLSREGTLTPMTESSWIDECLTPSSCPGTPDATLDLPMQQPSAVERLSASGQVGCSTQFSQNKLMAKARVALGPHLVLLLFDIHCL